MGPMRWGASLAVRKMAVGPSAPPMIPMAPASLGSNPRARAPRKVMKIPIWAAAPKSMSTGRASMVEKSVMRADAQKDQGRIHPRGHAEIQVVEHAVALVNGKAQTLEHRDVAHEDAKADGNQQQGLVMLGHPQVNKNDAHHDHDHDTGNQPRIKAGILHMN